MLPRIETPFGPIYTYVLCCVLGTLAFFQVLHVELRNDTNRGEEEAFIFPATVVSGIAAFFSSVVVDAIFKVGIVGRLELRGSTFYGGLLGACLCMCVIIKLFGHGSGYGLDQWLDLLTLPLITFHACGRMGCFFAGCCYGVQTDSAWGMVFPDNPEMGVYHHGVACLPTQLFEAAALVVIALLLLRVRHRFVCYLTSYASIRFIIELVRGDFRGFSLGPLSPAQLVSLAILLVVLVTKLVGPSTDSLSRSERVHRSIIGGRHGFS